jgi:hypothetical protein
MITLIERGEDQCMLCTREGTKKGYRTRSERMGEAFLCLAHIDKLMEIEEAMESATTPIEGIGDGQRAEIAESRG